MTEPASRLIVPAYFHPATHQREWAWLAERAEQVELVVLNLADGAGRRPDVAYQPVLERLRSASVTVCGYIDTNYGRRPVPEVVADLTRYQDWYLVDGVFLDRASAAAEHLTWYARLAAYARGLGARVIALNHGAHPVESYAEHADLLGTFEGPWDAYLELAVPRWVRSRPAAQFFHLLHSVPPACFADARRLVQRRNAGCAYITDRGGANPWDGIPRQAAPPDGRVHASEWASGADQS